MFCILSIMSCNELHNFEILKIKTLVQFFILVFKQRLYRCFEKQQVHKIHHIITGSCRKNAISRNENITRERQQQSAKMDDVGVILNGHGTIDALDINFNSVTKLFR